MTPRLMLSLWRERWGKAAGTSFKVPYVRGKFNQWTQGLPYVDAWSVSGVSALAFLLGLVSVVLIMGIGLSLNSQIVFSIFFVGVALYVRRYAGTLVTLILVAMAVIASTRYLYWRLNATLVPDFSLEFTLGLYLWVAECYLALFVFVSLIQAIWPLRRAPVPLSPTRDEWPIVDIFILCHDHPHAAIKSTAIAAQQLDWPRKKLKIHLIAAGQRPDLQALAGSIGAHHHPCTENITSRAEFINAALSATEGELITIFESGQMPGKQFLQLTVGWFLRDEKLGMVQTPHHFLSPKPPRHALGVFRELNPAQSCAVLRRVAVEKAGGIDTSPVTEHSHLAVKLDDTGYGCAYIDWGLMDELGSEGQNSGNLSENRLTAEAYLVENPFVGHTLFWKRRIASFRAALQFYYPAPKLLFFAAPAAYLALDVQIIHTSPELIAAYALPHFVHAHIARARTHGRDRFTLVADIKETTLAWYLLVPTTLTLLRTKLSQLVGLLAADKPHEIPSTGPKTRFSLGLGLPYVFVLSMTLVGFFSGLSDVLSSASPQLEKTVMYLLWCSYNLALLMATLAVAEEARQVLLHTRSRLHMPAMIKLPSGRTVSCTTENFPDPMLGLVLPISVSVSAGSAVSISIFHDYRELVLPATVLSQRDQTLRLRIADSAQHDYQNFAVTALSRGPEWPKWLPGRSADRPLPKWIIEVFGSITARVLDRTVNISQYLRRARLGSWIQIWKKRND